MELRPTDFLLRSLPHGAGMTDGGAGIPVRASQIIPANALQVIPAKALHVIPANALHVIPAKALHVIPAKAGIQTVDVPF